MEPDGWLLTAAERDNAATVLDRRHPGGQAWSVGNEVTVLVHGATYFAQLLVRIRRMVAGDVVMFTDWRGDPDERLDGPGTEVGDVLANAASRGVVVKGLVWRSHLDKLQFSAAANRNLGDEIERGGGEFLLDMRVRVGGSHHQKLVVLRHPGRPELDVAYVGGIDLCHSRNDDREHGGDPQPQSIARVYGPTVPWHDVQAAIRGPAVGDVETVFRERWEDPAPLSRSPLRILAGMLRSEDRVANALPPQLPDPAPCGDHTVQLLRTYPFRRGAGYPFAPDGERSVARGYGKALRRARRLVYLEDQYLWSTEVARDFCDALRRDPGLRIVAVIPRFPDQDGALSAPPVLLGRRRAMELMAAAGPGRVAVYGVENHAGTPVYVHAKVCVVDDVWAAVGSDNVNRRSWTHDSEVSCAVLDATADSRRPADPAGLGDGARSYARDLRLTLAREHLDRADGDDADLVDPVTAFDAFRDAATALDRWHARGQRGDRPPGRLRTVASPELGRWTSLWAQPLTRSCTTRTVGPGGCAGAASSDRPGGRRRHQHGHQGERTGEQPAGEDVAGPVHSEVDPGQPHGQRPRDREGAADAAHRRPGAAQGRADDQRDQRRGGGVAGGERVPRCGPPPVGGRWPRPRHPRRHRDPDQLSDGQRQDRRHAAPRPEWSPRADPAARPPPEGSGERGQRVDGHSGGRRRHHDRHVGQARRTVAQHPGVHGGVPAERRPAPRTDGNDHHDQHPDDQHPGSQESGHQRSGRARRW